MAIQSVLFSRLSIVLKRCFSPAVFIPIAIIFVTCNATLNLYVVGHFPGVGLQFVVAIESLKVLFYVLLAVKGYRVFKVERVLGWLLISIGSVIWIPGQALIAWTTFAKSNPYISGSSAESLLLPATICAISGVIAVGFHGLGGREKVRASLNALSFGACITFIAIVSLSAMSVNGSKINLDGQLLNLVYFTIDVMLISFPLAIILFRRFDRNTLGIAFGMFFLSTSDIYFLFFDIRGVVMDTSMTRSIQSVALVFWLFASTRKSGKPTKSPTIRGENYLTIGVNSVVAITIGVAAFGIPRMEKIPYSISYSFLLVFVVVLIAQLAGHFENKRLQKIQSISIQSITKSEEKFQELATHDSLTKLHNRTYFIDALKSALEEVELSGERIAVLFIDLDRFKEINDSFGHITGDVVISELANRIRQVVDEKGLVCRLGGDEFAVMIHGEVKRNEALNLAKLILEVSTNPIEIAGSESYLSCSIGIAFSGESKNDSQTILKNADAAMYRAKELGRNRIEFADDVVKPALEMNGWTLSELHHAIVDGQIEVYYQPIHDLANDKIVSFEALARWNHPKIGMISPEEFIAVAEDNGLIIDIGNAVISKAIKQLKEWDREDITMNINLSFRQLSDPNLIEYLLDQCKRNGVSPSSINFEMTESALLGDVRNAIATLNEIRRHGFKLHIDDFGTGYSSLSYLKKFPIDGFKIDKAYIQGYGQNEDDTAIANALIGLGISMGLTMTAEGVSSIEVRNALGELGCTYGQGYFYSKALPASEIVLPKKLIDDEQATSLKSA